MPDAASGTAASSSLGPRSSEARGARPPDIAPATLGMLRLSHLSTLGGDSLPQTTVDNRNSPSSPDSIATPV
eukprot:2538721-Pyramimonas_sp.AAC.1